MCHRTHSYGMRLVLSKLGTINEVEISRNQPYSLSNTRLARPSPPYPLIQIRGIRLVSGRRIRVTKGVRLTSRYLNVVDNRR